MVALHLLASVALVTAAWYLPGRALLGSARDRPRGERLLLTIAVGWAATSGVAFSAAMSSGAPLTRLGVLTAGAAVGAAGLVLRRPPPAASEDADPPPRGSFPRGGFAALLLVTALVALGRYQASDLHLTCENYPSALLLGLPIGKAPRPAVLTTDFEQNLGTSAIVGPTVALLGIGGYRAAFAGWLVLITGGVALLLHAAGASPRWCIGGAALVLAQPLLADIREIDPNLNTLAFSAMAFALIRPGARPAPSCAAVAFGVAVGSRYVMLPGGLALVWLLLGSPGGRRASIRALAVAAVAAVPVGVHNLATYGNPLVHPSLTHFPSPQPHEILGFPFTLRAALNWPFTAAVVRSPFNPHPTALMFAHRLTSGFGAVGIALTVLGGWTLLRRPGPRRRLALGLIAYGLPTAALLAVLENWTEPSRLWLLVCLLLPVLVLLPLGLECAWLALRARRLAPLTALVLTAVLTRTGVQAALDATANVAVDPRLRAAFPTMPSERPHELALLRRQYGDAAWLPLVETDPSIFALDPGSWRAWAGELRAPDLEAHRIPVAHEIVGWIFPERFQREFAAPFFRPAIPLPRSTARALTVDLGRPPTDVDATPLTGGGNPAPDAVDLGGRQEPLARPSCRVPWGGIPLDVVAAGRELDGRSVAFVMVIERPDRATQVTLDCEARDLTVKLAVPSRTAVAFFYVRQVLPTVMFQRSAVVLDDRLELLDDWTKV